MQMEETRPAARKYYGLKTGKKQACVFSEDTRMEHSQQQVVLLARSRPLACRSCGTTCT